MSEPYECWRLEDIPSAAGDEELRYRGYVAGRADEPEPGPNHPPAYRHGWWTGASDAGRVVVPEWMRVLAHKYVAQQRAKR